MSDEIHDQPGQPDLPPAAGWPPVGGTPPEGAPRVGFCQDCGKPLTAETVRTVGTGVFCEPCLTARVGAPIPGYGSGYGAVPPMGTPLQPLAGDANPTLAGWLGLIPGVGAMYNGQYSKAVAHLFIFVVLASLKDNVSHVFDVFVAAWVFYQVFDAYHTAKARRDGLPLPNPFGLNDIGERLGWTTGPHGWHRNPAPGAGPATPPPTPPPYASAGGPATPPPVNPPQSGDWVGYVPPTHFAGNAPPPYAGYTAPPPYVPPAPAAAWSAVPPVPPVVPPAVPPTMTPVPAPPLNANRLPAGAIWLIALGVLILAANLVPHWGISERWWPPVLLAGLSVWIFLRRIRRLGRGPLWIFGLRAPIVLMALAIFTACHAAYYMISFGLFCAVLFILLGVLLLLERTIGTAPQAAAGYVPAQGPFETAGRASFVPPAEAVPPGSSGPIQAEPDKHEGEGL